MKSRFRLILVLLLQALSLYPVGAGLGLYRKTSEGIEFLLVKDPSQKSSWRQGFEFPAGTIGDYGHRSIDQLDGKKIDALPQSAKKDIPVFSYIRGAVRECLEELLFVPACSLINADVYNKNGKINKKIEKNAIEAVVQEITKQEMIYLRSIQGRSNYTIFFWDVTNLPTDNLLQQIQDKRTNLLSRWFSRVSAIGAEPDQFAWVNAKELKNIINKAQDEKQIDRIKGTYLVNATELSLPNFSLQHNVQIKLSPAFVGLISKCAQSDHLESSMSAVMQLVEKRICLYD